MSARVAVGLLPLVALALGACATAPACAPATIMVRAKDSRTQWRQEPQGLMTTGTGHVREVYRDVFVPERWLQDEAGRWHEVSDAVWQAARVGQPAEVCR